MTFFPWLFSSLSAAPSLILFSRLMCSVIQPSLQGWPCRAGPHLAYWSDYWVCCELVQVFFPSVVAECTPAGRLNPCFSCSFSRFHLGDAWTLHRQQVEKTEAAFILYLETCVLFKLGCKPGVVNGFSLAGQSNSSHRGVEVISICDSRRCRAELLCMLPVKHKPCWQGSVEGGAVPRLSNITSATCAHECLTPHLQRPLQSLTAILLVPLCGKY